MPQMRPRAGLQESRRDAGDQAAGAPVVRAGGLREGAWARLWPRPLPASADPKQPPDCGADRPLRARGRHGERGSGSMRSEWHAATQPQVPGGLPGVAAAAWGATPAAANSAASSPLREQARPHANPPAASAGGERAAAGQEGEAAAGIKRQRDAAHALHPACPRPERAAGAARRARGPRAAERPRCRLASCAGRVRTEGTHKRGSGDEAVPRNGRPPGARAAAARRRSDERPPLHTPTRRRRGGAGGTWKWDILFGRLRAREKQGRPHSRVPSAHRTATAAAATAPLP